MDTAVPAQYSDRGTEGQATETVTVAAAISFSF